MLCVGVAVLLLTACNDAIFIDDLNLPDETYVTLGGGWDQWSAAYSGKGLTKIVFEYPSGEKKYLRYEDKDGKVVAPDCPPSQLGAIVYDNPLRSFYVGFYGDILYVTSLYNASSADSFTLLLEYDYGAMKRIEVQIEAGAPLEMTYWNPTGDLMLQDDYETLTRSASLTNNGPVTQRWGIRPYTYMACSHMVTPDEEWANGLTLTMPMLEYFRGNWVWADYQNVELGVLEDVDLHTYLFNEEIEVEVPPFKKATVVFTVHKTLARQTGFVQLFNPADETYRDLDVTWSSYYPTTYEYTVEYE